MPDHGDVTQEVTAPGPTNDGLDPECPWIMLAIVHLGARHQAWHRHHKVDQILN